MAGTNYIYAYFDGEKLQRDDWEFYTYAFGNKALPELFDCEWTGGDTFRIKSNISDNEAEFKVLTQELSAAIGKPLGTSKGFETKALEFIPYEEASEYSIRTNMNAGEVDIYLLKCAEFSSNISVTGRLKFKFVPGTVSWELVSVEFQPGADA